MRLWTVELTCTDNAGPDVVGHEYGHSIANSQVWTGSSFVGIVTSGESGSLEESWGDLLGEAFELHTTGTHDWQIGTESHRIFRSMANPTSITNLATGLPFSDSYLHPNFFTGPEDSGGIHFNAGIPNKAIYLISEGGSFNGFDVTGIGMDKVLQIWYLGISDTFGTNPTFNSAFDELLIATDDLYGDTELLQVYLGLRAVEMNLSRSLHHNPPPGDYNQDGLVDILDADLWTATEGDSIFVTPGTADMRADGNHDGIIDTADLQFWQLQAADTADFDGDNDIDGADFLAWQRGFGTDVGMNNVAPQPNGNANQDQFINADDLAIWQTQYGDILPPLAASSTTVPEPSGLALLLSSLACLYRRAFRDVAVQ